MSNLRLYHIINIPNEAFRFEVNDVETAIILLKALAEYDLFLGDGEDRPYSTVSGRRQKRAELCKASGRYHLAASMFRAYDAYQLKLCPGGVPLVVTNVQGLETLEDDEWVEFYDEEGRDIREIEVDSTTV